LRVRWRGQGASFRQIQQRYEPHAGTLRAIEIVENSPTYSERPQPTAHASRDRGDKRNYTKAFKETSRRRKVGFSDLSMEIFSGIPVFSAMHPCPLWYTIGTLSEREKGTRNGLLRSYRGNCFELQD